jgi:hypothetical protein
MDVPWAEIFTLYGFAASMSAIRLLSSLLMELSSSAS